MELKAQRKARRKLLYYRISGAVVASAWIGSFLGLSIGFAIAMEGNWTPGDLWRFPLFVLVIATMFGLPAASIGLLAAGLPLAWAIREVSLRWWFFPLGGIIGAIVGRAGSYLIRTAFLGGAENLPGWYVDPGVLTGIFAGILWAVFGRNLFSPDQRGQV